MPWNVHGLFNIFVFEIYKLMLVNLHYKNPTKNVSLAQSIHHHVKCSSHDIALTYSRGVKQQSLKN